jgi:hypothetical protein
MLEESLEIILRDYDLQREGGTLKYLLLLQMARGSEYLICKTKISFFNTEITEAEMRDMSTRYKVEDEDTIQCLIQIIRMKIAESVICSY